MTLAAVAPVSSNQTAIWVVGFGLAFAAVAAVCLFVLWFGSAVLIDKLEDRIEVLERNWAEQFGPPAENEPAAEEQNAPVDVSAQVNVEEQPGDDCPTDEFPVAPATVPDGMPLAVQTALLDQRPSPVPREVEYVERTFNIGGTLQTYRTPVKREEAS